MNGSFYKTPVFINDIEREMNEMKDNIISVNLLKTKYFDLYIREKETAHRK